MNQTKNLTHHLCKNFVTFYGNAGRLQNNTGIKVRGSREMSKKKKTENQTTNGNGRKTPEATPKYERLPKDYEPDESEAAKAFMKAVRMTRKRLFPELYAGTKKRV